MHNSSPKYELGQPIAEPTVFRPTAQWVNDGHIYRVDIRRLICKRIEIDWRKSKPAYFTIARTDANFLDLRGVQKKRARSNKEIASWRRPVLSLAFTSGLAALCLLVYPYYPEVKYNLEQTLPHRVETQAVQAPVSAVNFLSIPKIGVTANILEAPNLDILDREQGVWHQTGALEGNVVLAGHRFKYLPPNTTTFYNLNKLEPGDTAVMDQSGRRYVYVVKEVRTVKADDVGVLNSSSKPQLTLYTCSDKKETERIVVVADLLP